MMKFFIATKNKHKLDEIARMLSPLGVETICENDLDKTLPEVEETGASLEENALLKAVTAVEFTGLPSVADDSGLFVDALNGAPGIYSARFAGEPCNNSENNKLLLQKLSGIPKNKRTAHFASAIACVFPDGRRFTVNGEVKGIIGFEIMGTNGFGYDPLFMSEIGCFGELTAEKKDSISHRAVALKRFVLEVKKFID